MQFLVNQSRTVNPSFFFASSYRRLFVPTTFSKVAELDSQSFFGEILPPFGCGDFPETLQGLKLCHSNLRFTFATGTIKHQAIGRPAKVHGEIRLHGLRAPPSQSERTFGQITMFAGRINVQIIRLSDS